MKDLIDKIDLFVTGTCMNRIPKDTTISKALNQFRTMTRGDFKHQIYTYEYNTTENTDGLISWKDRTMLYILTNKNWPTTEVGHFYRPSTGGLICLQRPKVVEDYNRNIGDVDLADMRGLHCNSILVVGQNCW